VVSLSTHVLDVEGGSPARAVRVELYDGDELRASAQTDEEGRIAELAAGLEAGEYRLVFHPRSPFFGRLELAVTLEEGHYHVPLLVSSYSCTTYRGA
jgi:5-hydroxyisourate hydrolase